ncbi:lactadherin-like [Stylophora pistillata]|uniref:lactadherin-like n=1 Tax=Stylophora pistillata TaxID=50429 RepID=UPI000C03F9FC|nr:lactadherin-like [Stylophora pistillata]
MQSVVERRKGITCKEALGLEDGRIPDSAFSASSVERHDTSPPRVRLNSDTAWSARTDDNMPWVQVDLGKDAMIKKIATQGRRGSYKYTKTYTISSRADGETDFVMYREDNVVKVFQGNIDANTVVFNVLKQHITARFVRFWPKTWASRYRTMRAELYGCFLQ